MDEKTMLSHINELVDEEKSLRAAHPDGLTDSDRQRLQHVEVQLDQCWDLLRQRRARAEAGEDTADIAERSGDEVEHYLQ